MHGPTEHGHPSDWGTTKALQLVDKMKQQGSESKDEFPCAIIQKSMLNVGEETALKMPRRPTLKKTIQRVQGRGRPVPPSSFDDHIIIPDEYVFINGQRFLLRDTHKGKDRQLIFATEEGLCGLSMSKY